MTLTTAQTKNGVNGSKQVSVVMGKGAMKQGRGNGN